VEADRSEAFHKLVEHLSKWAQNREVPVTEETEIYRDLGIHGDEIVDLVWWLEKEFGVKAVNINPFKYAPSEAAFFGIVRMIRRIRGVEYESLKVSDIVSAIEAGRWPDEAAS